MLEKIKNCALIILICCLTISIINVISLNVGKPKLCKNISSYIEVKSFLGKNLFTIKLKDNTIIIHEVNTFFSDLKVEDIEKTNLGYKVIATIENSFFGINYDRHITYIIDTNLNEIKKEDR